MRQASAFARAKIGACGSDLNLYWPIFSSPLSLESISILRPNFIFNSRPSVPVGTQFAFIYALMLAGSDSTCILDRSQKDRQLNGQGLFSEDGDRKCQFKFQ